MFCDEILTLRYRPTSTFSINIAATLRKLLGVASAGSRTSTQTTRNLGTGYMIPLGGSNSLSLLGRLAEGYGESAGLCLCKVCKFSKVTHIHARDATEIYSQSSPRETRASDEL
jgi:hypothetical protein